MMAQRPLGHTEYMRRSHAEVTYIVIFQETFGIEAMTDVCEGSGRVFAGFLEQDEVTARMLVHLLRDVVDLVSDDQPQVARAGALPDLIPGVAATHKRLPPLHTRGGPLPMHLLSEKSRWGWARPYASRRALARAGSGSASCPR